MSRVFRKVLRVLAAFVAVLILGMGVLIWRVASEPITSDTLTPYIEKALTHLLPSAEAKIERTLLIWDNTDHSLALRGETIKIINSQGDVLALFPNAKFKLSVLGLLRGRLMPSELSIEAPQIWMTRRADGLWTFSGAQETEAPSEEGTPALESLRALAEEITSDVLLHDLSLTRATILVHDEKLKQDWSIDVPEISLRHGWRSLTGRGNLALKNGDKSSIVQLLYDYDRVLARHKIRFQFSDLTPSLFAGYHVSMAPLAAADLPITGEIALIADRDLSLKGGALRLVGGAGFLHATDLWDAPRAVKAVNIKATYEADGVGIQVEEALVDFGGPKLSMNLKGTASQDPAYDMDFIMDIRLTDLPMNDFGAVWPKPIITDARAWIVSSMSQGLFTAGNVTLRGKWAWQDLENMVLASGEGKIAAQGALVDYLTGMPKVEDVAAEATFDLDHMDVHITRGSVGPLKILPFSLKITDFQQDTQNIEIPLKIAGPAKEVVKILDVPLLDYAKEVGLTPDDTDGRVEGVLTMKFPLLDTLMMKDVELQAKAKLFDFGAQKLIPGIGISLGNLDLDLDKNGFDLKGTAALNKVLLNLVWRGNFGEIVPRYKATLTGNVAGDQWAAFGLDLTRQIKGPGFATIEYLQPQKGLSQLSGDVQFKEAEIHAAELGWDKAIGVPATLTFAADIPTGENVKLHTLEIKSDNVKIKGDGTLQEDSLRLLGLNLKPFIVGRNNATLRYTQGVGPKGVMKLSVEGEAFDITGLSTEEEKDAQGEIIKDNRTKEYKLKVKRLFTDVNGYLAQAQATLKRDAIGWTEINLHGIAQGTHPLDMKLGVQEGRNTFLLTCDDFGVALKGLGFTDTVTGGSLEIRGYASVKDPRVIEGKIKVGGFSVKGLPALVRLLSAASPFGFVDFVTGEAGFDHLRGKFSWQGDKVELIKVRAAGSVFGLNIEGPLNIKTGEGHLHGTLVPFSFFNSIIGIIPLLGDVITGGDGEGVIAASYTVKGRLSDPEISVNPVSLLTPGFLRNIFFSGDESENGEEPEPALPAKEEPPKTVLPTKKSF